jgi:hypothetical protein
MFANGKEENEMSRGCGKEGGESAGYWLSWLEVIFFEDFYQLLFRLVPVQGVC